MVAVVSAMGKETDQLLHLAGQVSKTRPGREMDMLITAGERKATALVCMALHDLGVPADSFTGSQAGFLTDGNHTNARILEIRPDRLEKAVADGRVPVVGGSQGVSPDHNVTFLGRGGSDTTAVGIAAAMQADSCELYTDVSGVFTADPRVVPRARRLGQVSFDEMLEMCGAGCPKPAMRAVEFAPHPPRHPPRALRLHLGARHVDHRGGPARGASHRVRCGRGWWATPRSPSPGCPTRSASPASSSGAWPSAT